MARDFNGTTDRVDYASAFNTTGQALTICADVWCDLSQPVTNADYIFNSAVSGGGAGTFFAQHPSSTFRFQFARISDTVSKTRVTNSFSIATGEWHRLICTDDGSVTAANTHIYLDGTELAYSTNTDGTGTETTANSGFQLGGRGSDDARNFDGRVANLGAWNRVLSASERAILDKGYLPRFIPNSLKFAPPLIREIGDPFTGSGTADGTTVVEHPRIIMPRRRQIIGVPAAAGGLSIPVAMHHYNQMAG